MEAHLSSHHRNTVEKIFSHPSSGNIEGPAANADPGGFRAFLGGLVRVGVGHSGIISGCGPPIGAAPAMMPSIRSRSDSLRSSSAAATLSSM
jgi:hypothetical protein